MGAETLLGRTRAMFEQAMSWSKTLTGLSDFTFMNLYMYLVLSHNKMFHRYSLKAFKLLKSYKYNLVRVRVHAGHIPPK